MAIGIDLGKSIFHLAAVDTRGQVVQRKKLSRLQLLRYTGTLRACLIGMEAGAMRFVPLKTPEQLDLQALDRVRDRLVARRTSVINQLRAFLLERGITIRQERPLGPDAGVATGTPGRVEDTGDRHREHREGDRATRRPRRRLSATH